MPITNLTNNGIRTHSFLLTTVSCCAVGVSDAGDGVVVVTEEAVYDAATVVTAGLGPGQHGRHRHDKVVQRPGDDDVVVDSYQH